VGRAAALSCPVRFADAPAALEYAPHGIRINAVLVGRNERRRGAVPQRVQGDAGQPGSLRDRSKGPQRVPPARTRRCASARTCQLCQPERRASTAASTFSAVTAIHSASMTLLRGAAGWRVLLIMVWVAGGESERNLQPRWRQRGAVHVHLRS
jgi:NAD(P)-dependent dehydrogenase (short-subunit alcohol dehydrogenase family)